MVLFLVGRAIASGLGTVSRGIARAGSGSGSGISVNARLEGLEDLTRQLNSLGINFPKSKLRKAVNKGARLPLYTIRKNAPSLSGELRKGIIRAEEVKWKRNKKLKKVVMDVVIDKHKNSIFQKPISEGGRGERGGRGDEYAYYPFSQNYGWAVNKMGRRVDGKRFIENGIDATTEESYKVVVKTIEADMRKLIGE